MKLKPAERDRISMQVLGRYDRERVATLQRSDAYENRAIWTFWAEFLAMLQASRRKRIRWDRA